jgi:mono/diheme cytochrome c family protein
MAVLAIVLLFVLLGLGVFILAMSGGPRGAGQRVQTQSRRGRRGAVLLFVLTILVLGVAVPAAVIATDKNRDSIPEANVRQLTDLQKRGADLFGQRCQMCHTLKAANANGKTGPNLDDAPRNKALVLDAIENGRSSELGQMPARVFDGEDAEAVAEFVAVATGGSLEEPQGEETPQAEETPSE